MNIDVSVKDGRIVCHPTQAVMGKGHHKITWKLTTKGYRFTGLSPLPEKVFKSRKIDSANEMSIVDDNPGDGMVDYPYQISLEKITGDAGTLELTSTPVIRNVPN